MPTSMRASQADRYARQKANREARAAFTQYLKDNAIFSESGDEGVTIETKSGTVSSETLDISARIFSSRSSALLNGLTTLLDRIDGEGDKRTCVVVLGWSQKSSSAAGQVQAAMTANANPTSSSSQNTFKGNSTASAAQKPQGNTDTITRIGNLDDF